jgi:predicted transcriptional regulator
MEVQLTNDLQARLTQLAQRQGRDSGALIAEAVERLVNYDDWFVSEVESGLSQIARGQTLSHEEVGTRLDHYLTSRQTRA